MKCAIAPARTRGREENTVWWHEVADGPSPSAAVGLARRVPGRMDGARPPAPGRVSVGPRLRGHLGTSRTGVMLIAILGATGPTGKLLTSLALEGGHEVVALVRNASKLPGADKLRVVVGDATNATDVLNIVNGADVVVSCLGHVPGDAPMMTTAFKNIISAASKQAKPPRCVLMTTIGVGRTSFHVKLVLSLLVASCKVIADYEEADKFVRLNGKVPYVIVRPAHLTDDPSTDKYKTSLKGPYHIAMKISRADVASFLLRAASSAEFENKAVQLYA